MESRRPAGWVLSGWVLRWPKAPRRHTLSRASAASSYIPVVLPQVVIIEEDYWSGRGFVLEGVLSTLERYTKQPPFIIFRDNTHRIGNLIHAEPEGNLLYFL